MEGVEWRIEVYQWERFRVSGLGFRYTSGSGHVHDGRCRLRPDDATRSKDTPSLAVWSLGVMGQA